MYKEVREIFMDKGYDDAIAYLTDELSIKVKPFHDGMLLMLNYDQIDSPKTNPIVMQCRSLIVDQFGEVVSKKFDRFFNIGEAPEITSQVDLSDCTIFNKEDGSLIGFWYDPICRHWEISTRSMPFAEGEFERADGTMTTFRDMILETLGVSYEQFNCIMVDHFLDDETYIFEWCHPENRIVTKYEQPKLYLTGATSKLLGDSPGESVNAIFAVFETCGVQNVELIHSVQSTGKTTDELKEIVNALPNLQEGFVIRCNKTGIRVKLKSNTYLVAHRIRGEFKVPREKDLVDLVRTNESDEFIAYFPEWKDRIEAIQSVMRMGENSMQVLFDSANKLNQTQKDFALSISELGNVTKMIMFQCRKNNTTVHEEIKKLTEAKYLSLYNELKGV